MLARFASDPERSRGRRHPIEPDALRNAYQRDRDRIVHCTAFRRLVYKTQVFLNHEGDLYRTRLTHSLEVAQLARAMARALGLHEDLCEAIALAHDLGHTPFGHAGQDALDEAFRAADPDAGGFEHNLQSLRVVDLLEERYAGHDGLNLSFETREGVLKHCSRRNALALEAAEPGGVGRRFLDGTQPSLEAQLTNLADEFAYNTHDIDDGVRSGLIGDADLLQLPPLERLHAATLRDHPRLTGRRLLAEVLRRMLSGLVHDAIGHTQAALLEARPSDADAVRAAPALVGSGAVLSAEMAEVKQFLRRRLYRHPRVLETTDAGKQIVRELFAAYLAEPGQLPPEHAQRPGLARAVTDYIAGMTDRFALREHARLYGRPARPAALDAAG